MLNIIKNYLGHKDETVMRSFWQVSFIFEKGFKLTQELWCILQK